jgi:hypothetical protein
MPNKPGRDKKIRPVPGRSGARNRPSVDSVKSLLGRPSPVLASIADQASRQRHWRTWLGARLPAELLSRITGIVESEGELVIFTQSAGWGVRLRYAMAELEPELRAADAAIESITVRVLPDGAPTGDS